MSGNGVSGASTCEPASPRDAKLPHGILWLLFLGLVGVFGFTAHGYLENLDVDVTMHAARAWYLRGDPGLVPNSPDSWPAERVIADHIEQGKYGLRGTNGKYYVWFPIGHQLLMVPCIAVGELLGGWFPEAERVYEASQGPIWGPVTGQFYWSRFLISFLPALAAAGSVVMLLSLAHGLGCSRREALLVALVSTFCTQFWPGASETMSDPLGGFFLLAMAALVLRYQRGFGGGVCMLVAGLAGGWAVLVRYPHVIPVGVLAVVAAISAVQRGRRRDLVLLALGGLPQIILLLAANLYRFDSLTETGYSAGANAAFFSYPPYLGIAMILLAPGKGALWFSPPLWGALGACFRRGLWCSPLLPALLVFLAPVVLSGHSSGWGAGQCWGVRYVTAGVTLLVTVALAIHKPWRRRPRLFVVVCGLGLLVAAGGVLAPYRGHQELANAAGRVLYPTAGAHLDNNVNVDPRLSPLHTHWIYAWLSATGRLEQGGAANTTVPLFGVNVPDERATLRMPQEDAGFRHWWILFAHAAFGWPLLPLLLLWGAATAALLVPALRALLRPSSAG